MNTLLNQLTFFECMKAHWVFASMHFRRYYMNKGLHRLQLVARCDWSQTSAGGFIGTDLEFRLSAQIESNDFLNVGSGIFSRKAEI